ncbi:DapH/DapD/GlmU-related protein [Calothrix sp. PCC 7507]|uniref:acyltransferase n=1 Tax=Calothrix sp. PCC 7507 TaxID=99598 RepID=UPI00029ED503|nr:acyltransferase [Calothrix sp. PCC 7507]AFY33732.1 hexapeptide repeat-containing transferase [Calothrix sp. PCC 7507]
MKIAIASTTHQTNSLALQRARELIITNIFGGIPRPLGTLLRRLTYRWILARMGEALYVQEGVEILGGYAIEIGNDVKILRDVRLTFNWPKSRLRLGSNICIERGVDINASGENCSIEIGDESFLGPYVCIAGAGNVKIGRRCLIASQTGIYANNHREYGMSYEGITIEDNCWLGTGVKVLDGVTIGKSSVIGAGAVVTKDIPPNSVAVGVPAKVIRTTTGVTH